MVVILFEKRELTNETVQQLVDQLNSLVLKETSLTVTYADGNEAVILNSRMTEPATLEPLANVDGLMVEIHFSTNTYSFTTMGNTSIEWLADNVVVLRSPNGDICSDLYDDFLIIEIIIRASL